MCASPIHWNVRPVAALTLACGLIGSASAQEYTSEVLGRLVALPGIPATFYNHVATDGGAIGDGYGSATSNIPHAMYMPPGASMPTDLHPSGFLDTYGLGGGPGQQVGYGWSNAQNQYRALLWTGTAASVVNLHPSGYLSSRAACSDGLQQGGAVNTASGSRAALWAGSASSFVNLHPAAYSASAVYGVGGGQQAGWAYVSSAPTLARAIMWSGTVESATELHSAAFVETFAFAAGGATQVGYGKVSGANPTRALMWSGTAASIVNLHPAGATGSVCYATNGAVQVGDCSLGGAAAWRGTAESFINLHAMLPSGAGWSGSRATSIDDDGVIYGRAFGSPGGVSGTYAVKWTPVPGCIADYNGAGDEGDILDFLDFFDDFGTCEGQPGPCGNAGDADVNGDTIVDILDFLDFFDSFGVGC